MKRIVLICCILLAPMSYAEEVAKAIIVRGKALAQAPDGSVVEVAKDMWFKEGTELRTEDKSFVKLLFVDKSQMNLGPNSQMKIDKFPQNDPGIVTLVKGQLRSKVTKNYMEMDKKDKSKLFIKTKTAAMGVRGTDFQVNYNPDSNFTSLVTFEGAVAMAKIDEIAGAAQFEQNNLEKIVSSDMAVMVTRGQFSGSSPETEAASVPVKINPIQLESMEKNESGLSEEGEGSASAKKPARSPVPPGVSGKAFSNKPQVEQQVAKTAGTAVVAKAEAAATKAMTSFASGPTKVNVAAAGAVVDVSSGKLLLPPKNAPIDPVTGMKVMPAINQVLSSGGKVDMEAAKSANIAVVELNVANQVATKSDADLTSSTRAPASEDSSSSGTSSQDDGSAIVAVDSDIVDTVIEDTQQDILDNQDLGVSDVRTQTSFDFNIQ